MNISEKNPDIRPGDIRICGVTSEGLIEGEPLEIVRRHFKYEIYWHVRQVSTGKIWTVPNDPQNSALHEHYLQILVHRKEDLSSGQLSLFGLFVYKGKDDLYV